MQNVRKWLAHTYMKANWGRSEPSPIFLSNTCTTSKHVRSCLEQGLYSSIIHCSCVSTFEWIARFVQFPWICICLWSKRTSLYNQTPVTQNKTILRCFSPRPLDGDTNIIFSSTLIKTPKLKLAKEKPWTTSISKLTCAEPRASFVSQLDRSLKYSRQDFL